MSTPFHDELDRVDADVEQEYASGGSRFPRSIASFLTTDNPRSTCCLYSGLIIVLVFPVTGIVFFAVGAGRFNSARSEFPDVNFSSPPATVIAFHWLFIIFISVFGGMLVVVAHTAEMGFGKLCGLVLPGLGALGWYIAYLVSYFRSAEYAASTNAWNLQLYNMRTAQIVASQPSVRFEGYVSLLNARCTLTPIETWFNGSVDASVIPSITAQLDSRGIVLVKMEIAVNFPSSQDVLIQACEKQIASCMSSFYITEWLSYSFTVDGFVSGAFVTPDGTLPGSLAGGAAVASGIFWAGVMHAYIVDAVPVATVKIVKDGAQFIRCVSCRDVKADCRWTDRSGSYYY